VRIVIDLQGAQSATSRFRGIGRYSVALAQAIALEAKQHEIWIALNELLPDAIEPLRNEFGKFIPQDRIRTFQLHGPVAELDPANRWRRKAAELLREKFLADLNPDVIHLSALFEGYMNEAVVSIGRADTGIPTAATLYDLIPLSRPEYYLVEESFERAYFRRIQSLKRADLLLAISESSRLEAIKHLEISPDRIATIAAGVDPSFRCESIEPEAKAALLRRYRLERPFILYTGGPDPHKNLHGLIKGFALLPSKLRSFYQLAIVGKISKEEQQKFWTFSRHNGLSENQIAFTGYVCDDDLRLLYNVCELFVLPSFNEGFGLPALEAMSCGAAVAGSNCTSIPEIINRQDALFDPKNPEDIAKRLSEILENPELRQDLRKWGLARAQEFTWQTTARAALQALEKLNRERSRTGQSFIKKTFRKLPLLAFVSNEQTSASGDTNLVHQILPSLGRHYEIIYVSDQPTSVDKWISAEFPIRSKSWFRQNAAEFDRIVYHFSEHGFGKEIVSLQERYPGVSILESFFLRPFYSNSNSPNHLESALLQALYDSHGYPALLKNQNSGTEATIAKFPCNGDLLHNSVGTICFSEGSVEMARYWFGEFKQIRDGSSIKESASSRPEDAATQLAELIEDLYAESPMARELKLIEAVARVSEERAPTRRDLAGVAVALASNRSRFGHPQLLFDITTLANHDARTGIQRVTRAILMALIANPPPGYRIEPIREFEGRYVYARKFTVGCICSPSSAFKDELVETRNGDIYLSVDWCVDVVPRMRSWFSEQRRRGVNLYFVQHDLLPLLMPKLFPEFIPPLAADWLNTVAEIADGIVCDSQTVADQLYGWLNEREVIRSNPLPIGFFHLGADLRASLPSKGVPPGSVELLSKLKGRPSLLIVGTLEPRKGHQQALAAMEALWARGLNLNLMIIGKQGWNTKSLAAKIRRHPQLDNQLFWTPDATDELLEKIYRSCSALLAPSFGEGFGLPLIEAAQFGLPIIARDIPVFREVAGDHAYYFTGDTAESLADAIRAWLTLGNSVPSSEGIAWQTWQESCNQLVDIILHQNWYRSYGGIPPADSDNVSHFAPTQPVLAR
jgi:glycosyltransferase involved in cell wall biosynthesis